MASITGTIDKNVISKTFTATAPGKVILFGEHAVVYGVPAVACCLSGLRVQVDVCIQGIASPYEEGPVFTVSLENVGSNKTILVSFPTTNFMDASRLTQRPASWSTLEGSRPVGNNLDAELLQNIEAMIATKCSTNADLKGNKGAISALTNLVYLGVNTLHIFQPPFDKEKSISIKVKSLGLPIGAGLGSSAAFSVATAAAMLSTRFSNIGGGDADQSFGEVDVRISDRRKADGQGEEQTLEISESNSNSIVGDTYIPHKMVLELINAWAHVGEKIMHGNPSGLDNTISTFGEHFHFRKDLKNSGAPIFAPIPNCPALRTLITNTKVPRETKVLVGNVRKLREEKREHVDAIWKGVEEIVKTFENIVDAKESSDKQDLAKTISSLFERNQNLLRDVGVSHPSLEIVCNSSRKYGFKSKLTGAGGGGCAVTFLGLEEVSTSGNDESDVKTKIKELMQELRNEHGFDCFECDIGGPGVRLARVIIKRSR